MIPLVDGTKVVKVKPYRYSSLQKAKIEKLVKEMLQNSIIWNSNNPFASLIVMVKNKDESWRLCIDYRQLNQLTIKDQFPIPLIEELLDKLGAVTYFFKLDLRSGCHQIKMWEQDIYKITFKTHERHYEFVVMPFGLNNAPSTFQSLKNKVFKRLLRRLVLVFFDDILVYSNGWQEHLTYLREGLQILKGATYLPS